MNKLFATALIGVATVAAQACEGAGCAGCGSDGRGCTPNVIDLKAVDTQAPLQEVAQPGVYYEKSLHGPGNPYKGEIQFGSESNRDVRIGYGDNSQWAWKRACCKDPVMGAAADCNCGKTVRRCRTRRVDGTHTETRYDAEEYDVPTADKQWKLMPTIVNDPVFQTVKVPVKAYRTEHRIEYRNHLAKRPPAVVFQTHVPVNPLTSECNCFSPYCNCAGSTGCGCSFPSCACAPQQWEMGVNSHTTGRTQSYVRRVPVKVPFKREYIKYIEQKVALASPRTVLRWQKVLTNGTRKVNVLRPTGVTS